MDLIRNVSATRDAVRRVASMCLNCKQATFTGPEYLPLESLADEIMRGRTAFTYFCTYRI